MTNTTNTTNTTEDRLVSLERSNHRWRLVAVGLGTLLAGFLIGGMGQPSTQFDGGEVVGVAGTGDEIYRVHRDGSVTYLKIKNGNRTAEGLWDWGRVLIDHSYQNKDKR
ncbi:MAG: hypothetical protein KC996_00945 [Phycisphaerales bacterium]|nr:hypothetical protein [Phycisphaerales bacterium]